MAPKPKSRFSDPPFSSWDPLLAEARALLKGRKKIPALRLRTATYLLVDYTKCLLDEFADRLGQAWFESWDIPKKVDRVLAFAPELKGWRHLISTVERARGKVAHTDFSPPDSVEICSLPTRLSMFRRSLTRELAKRAKGNSPSDPVEEILDRCEEELESLSSLEKGGYADQIADEEKERVSLLRRLLITTQAGDEASLGKLLEYATIELSRITTFQSETESRLGDDQKQWEWEQTQTGSQADDEN